MTQSLRKIKEEISMKVSNHLSPLLIANLLASAALFMWSPVYGSENSAEDTLPSPYFIDELHCSGINVRDINEGWLLSKDEVEAARKVEHQETCEKILRAFGIEKYIWLSPDDLERTSTLIKQSGNFEESDLSVKKSELKNHVHLFLKVKPLPKFLKSIASEFKFYSPGSGQDGNRITNKLTGAIINRSFAPILTSNFGFSLDGSFAGSPYKNGPQSVVGSDTSNTQQKDPFLADLYWKTQGSTTEHFVQSFGLHFVGDNAYIDKTSRTSFLIDGDFLWKKPANILKGHTFFGPAFIFSSASPFQPSSNDSNTLTFFPGVIFGYDYGHEFGNHLNLKLEYYATTQDRSITVYDLNGQYLFSSLNTYFIAGSQFRHARNSPLAQDRFYLNRGIKSDAFIGLAKLWDSGSAKTQVSAIFGTERLSDENAISISSEYANYVGLRYKLLASEWNINLGASYYFQRNY